MKKALASFLVLFLLSQHSIAQDKNIRKQALGVSFTLHDFTTAQKIRNNSIESVLRDDNWATFREMSPGLSLTYFKGLSTHMDFAGTLGASFVNYPMPGKPAFTRDALLLELDASINLKLFSEAYWVTPYLSAGIGASKYKEFYGGFIPLGGGIKLNIFDEAAIFLGTQYRVPVSAETTNYHLLYQLGVSGVIGKK